MKKIKAIGIGAGFGAPIPMGILLLGEFVGVRSDALSAGTFGGGEGGMIIMLPIWFLFGAIIGAVVGAIIWEQVHDK